MWLQPISVKELYYNSPFLPKSQFKKNSVIPKYHTRLHIEENHFLIFQIKDIQNCLWVIPIGKDGLLIYRNITDKMLVK